MKSKYLALFYQIHTGSDIEGELFIKYRSETKEDILNGVNKIITSLKDKNLDYHYKIFELDENGEYLVIIKGKGKQ